jgi:hypothetical protein
MYLGDQAMKEQLHHCGICGRLMTPENSKIHPELFLCDDCFGPPETGKTVDVRSSFAERAYLCPQSVQRDPNEIRVVIDELPSMGQALHYMNAMSIGHGKHVEADHAALMYRVEDSDELQRLAASCWKSWEGIRQWFFEPMTEVYLEHQFGPVRLTGHVDLLSLSPAHRQVRFADWKSSWIEEDHEQQMLAYATLLLATYPQYEEAWGAVIRPRHRNSDDARVYTRAETEAWLIGFVDRLTGQDSQEYHAGDHCWRCPRVATCPAHGALMAWSMAVMLAQKEQFTANGKLADSPRILLECLRRNEKFNAIMLEALKAEVAARGGEWEDLALVEEKRETIRYTPASQQVLMNAGFVSDDWEKIVRLLNTEIKKLAMQKAPKGKGQKVLAVEDLFEKLRETSAVEKTFIKKLQLRKRHATPSAAISSDSND